MRVLLVGEYSGVHTQFKRALQQAGHECVLASTGDGIKAFDYDMEIGRGSGSALSRTIRTLRPIVQFRSLTGFDVVQFINPFEMATRFGLWRVMAAMIAQNRRSFLIAAGCDSAYRTHISQADLDCKHCDGCLPIDIKSAHCPFEAPAKIRWNTRMAGMVDGIVPVAGNYAAPYRAWPNLRPVVPMPIDLAAIPETPNQVKGKISFFHGITRPGFKGSGPIRAGLERAAARWPGDIDLIIRDGLPFAQYAALLNRVNIVVDQTYSEVLAMNALNSMARNRIVMTRWEDRYCPEPPPCIRIGPDPEQITQQVGHIIESRGQIPAWGQQGRDYVARHHDLPLSYAALLRAWSLA